MKNLSNEIGRCIRDTLKTSTPKDEIKDRFSSSALIYKITINISEKIDRNLYDNISLSIYILNRTRLYYKNEKLK